MKYRIIKNGLWDFEIQQYGKPVNGYFASRIDINVNPLNHWFPVKNFFTLKGAKNFLENLKTPKKLDHPDIVHEEEI